jgi:hypothetical protein
MVAKKSHDLLLETGKPERWWCNSESESLRMGALISLSRRRWVSHSKRVNFPFFSLLLFYALNRLIDTHAHY